jgi:ribonucleotide reductase beta subunit family protein with ferritin-like domain
MPSFIDEQPEAMKAGIRHRNPKMGNEELKKFLKERMLKIYSRERKWLRKIIHK